MSLVGRISGLFEHRQVNTVRVRRARPRRYNKTNMVTRARAEVCWHALTRANFPLVDPVHGRMVKIASTCTSVGRL